MNRVEEMLISEEETGKMPEELMEKVVPASAVLRFRLLFLKNGENKTIHKVEVRSINFRDLMRHLKRGESVFITPKLLRSSSKHAKIQEDQTLCYFAHA